MGLTFVVGTPSDVFSPEFAAAVDAELRKRFALADGDEPYHSEELDAGGWMELQLRATSLLGRAPQLAMEAYQAVYVPAAFEGIQHVAVANAADPLQVGSLPALIEELRELASRAELPTDDLELMKLGAHYLEDEDPTRDLDVQTYVQLMLSAKQASARGQALWILVS